MNKKIASVLELSRYKIGDIVYWIYFAPKNVADSTALNEEDTWMAHSHPKVLVQRGPLKNIWPKNMKLPKLHNGDFEIFVNLMNSHLVIDDFLVTEISRSQHTGEFNYVNKDGFIMPESMLFDTRVSAAKERDRLLKMVSKWANN